MTKRVEISKPKLCSVINEMINDCKAALKKVNPIKTVSDGIVNLYFGFPDGSISEFNFDLNTYNNFINDGK